MGKYKKLVRDKIPDIIKSNGETPTVRVLDEVEYKQELEKKLHEEYLEVLYSTTKEERIDELADLIEVISALSVLEGSSLEEVIKHALEKREKRGSFQKRLFLEDVE